MADGSEIEKKGLTLGALDGSGLRVGIVHTRWNEKVVNALVKGAEEQLVRHIAASQPASQPARRRPSSAAQERRRRQPRRSRGGGRPDARCSCCGRPSMALRR